MALLVNLHGLLATDENFKEQEGKLGIRQKSINYRYFVNNETSKHLKGQALVDYIADSIVQTLLEDHPEEKEFVFHGNSAGGVIAAALAVHKDVGPKTKGIILNCSAGLGEELASRVDGQNIFSMIRKATNKETLKGVINEFVQIPEDQIPNWLVEEIYALVVKRKFESIPKIIQRGKTFMKYGDEVQVAFRKALEVLKTDNMPALVIGGNVDAVTIPPTITEMANELGTVPVFFDTGHIPHIQEPEKFNAAVNDYLKKIRCYDEKYITKNEEV